MFGDQKTLRFHSRQAHEDPLNREGVTKSDLSCRTCGKECNGVQARKRHEKIHENKVRCKFCEHSYQHSYLAEHLKLHELKKKEKNLICNICLKSFLTKKLLINHERIHNKFKCDICGHAIAKKQVLKHHLEVHLNPDKAECKICWKKFTNIICLKKRTRTIHNLNVEPSRLCCNVCHRICSNLVALQNHKSTHKASKTCPICSKLIKAQGFNKHKNLKNKVLC